MTLVFMSTMLKASIYFTLVGVLLWYSISGGVEE